MAALAAAAITARACSGAGVGAWSVRVGGWRSTGNGRCKPVVAAYLLRGIIQHASSSQERM
jgi:hypothetical protein